MRVALGIEYDGSGYHGWQTQDGVSTVQDAVERSLSKVADHPVRVVCAGRTDTGVHATGQVVHFDTSARRSERSWVFGANANLDKQICVLWAKSVHEGFHARFSARRRRYRYVIFNRPVRPGVLGFKVSWDYRPLNERHMVEAARYLIGEHDFSSFRALQCQAKSPVRTIHELTIKRHGGIILLDIEANAFLHHMVRNIAGVLMTIGAGDAEPTWAKEVLEMRDRTRGGITASAHGLYLVGVTYSPEFGIPSGGGTTVVC